MGSGSRNGSWWPRTDEGLRLFVRNFSATLSADPPAAGATREEAAELAALAAAYEAAFAKAADRNRRTSLDVAHKDAARDRAAAAFRKVAARIRADGRVPVPLKVALGLPAPTDGRRPRVPAPTTAPILHESSIGLDVHRLRYVDSVLCDTRRKPPGVAQIMLFAALAPQRVLDPAAAAFVGSFTRNPIHLRYEPCQGFLLASYFARWSTRTGLLGPWSAPVHLPLPVHSPPDPADPPTPQAAPARPPLHATEVKWTPVPHPSTLHRPPAAACADPFQCQPDPSQWQSESTLCHPPQGEASPAPVRENQG